MAAEHRTLLFSGRVQGVGFRQTAVMLADGLPVGGTVRNLPDGRVELVVEGSATAIDQLIELLRERFGTFIRTVEQNHGMVQGLPHGIAVTY